MKIKQIGITLIIFIFLLSNAINLFARRGGSMGGYNRSSGSSTTRTYTPSKPSSTYHSTTTSSSTRRSYYPSTTSTTTTSTYKPSHPRYNYSTTTTYPSTQTTTTYPSTTTTNTYPSTTYTYPSTTTVIPSNTIVYHRKSGSFIPVLLLFIIIFIVYRIVISRKKRGDSKSDSPGGNLFLVQVGLYYGDGALEKQLIQAGEAINTSVQEGLTALLREVSMLIQRNSHSIRWYHYNKNPYKDSGPLEEKFRNTVNQERIKLEKEEFSDIDGREVKRKDTDSDNLEEIIIISFTVAGLSDLDLDKKSPLSIENASKILQFFTSCPDDRLIGVNVTWNILDRDDMFTYYPELRSV